MSEHTRKILVTGSGGLIGWHMRVFLSTKPEVEVIPCNRQQFNDDAYLQDGVARADVVIHLAGMNRGDEDEIAAANVAIADRLIDACRETDSKPQIIYSSSTHADGDSKYGISKRTAGEHFAAWAQSESAKFCNLILPHVFGEHGKPFYNSVVSTFAHQIAAGESPTVTGDGQLNLMHCHDVALTIWEKIESGSSGDYRPQGTPIGVVELLERLTRLSTRYREGVIPNLDDPLDHRLYNTWKSYFPHDQRPISLTLHSDDRGHLFETIRSDGQGQVFLSTTHPNITRGNHFHFHKPERFLVISGKAKIRLRKVLTDEVHTYEVSGDNLQAIDIPTLHTHNISNVGDEPLVTLFWAGEHFDPENPDTYFLPVEDVAVSNA